MVELLLYAFWDLHLDRHLRLDRFLFRCGRSRFCRLRACDRRRSLQFVVIDDRRRGLSHQVPELFAGHAATSLALVMRSCVPCFMPSCPPNFMSSFAIAAVSRAAAP